MHACCLAVGKSSQGYLFWKEREKVSLKGRLVSNTCLCGAIFLCLVQEGKNALTRAQ